MVEKNDDIKKASKELEDLKQNYQYKLNVFNSLYQQKIKELEDAQGQHILDIDIHYNSKSSQFKEKNTTINNITSDIDDYMGYIDDYLNELEKMTKGDRK